MNNAIKLLGGIASAALVGYAGWRFTPVGKNVLNSWLFKKWKAMVKEQKVKKDINWEGIRRDLNNYDYQTHELLYFLTRGNYMSKKTFSPYEEGKFLSIISKLKDKEIGKSVALRQLEGVIFPS